MVSFAETFKIKEMKKLLIFLLLIGSAQSLLAEELGKDLQRTAWNSIFGKFLGETKKPIIFRNDIAVRLDGKCSAVDSACIVELIQDLKVVIPTRKIYFTDDEANLIFNINGEHHGRITAMDATGYSIHSTQNFCEFQSDVPKEVRKKVLYYMLCRSLVEFSPGKSGTTGISGCVFDEKGPDDIRYPNIDRPFDSFILKTLYADDFQEQFKNYFVKHASYRMYLIQMYHNELDNAFLLLGLLLSTILLSILIIKGAFKPHQWNWLVYNKQGLFLIAIGVLYTFCLGWSDLSFDDKDLGNLENLIISSLLAINLIFFAEKVLLKSGLAGISKITVNFSITLLVLAIVSFPVRYGWSLEAIIYNIPLRYNSLLPYILSVSLGRALYIFINDRYKSVINQKDVELAQMNELQKQAELQSLRARINPHFLYNALNSIASLATTDPLKTEKMALALSDFFKYAINREQIQFNSLQEELNAIRTYLEIEKVRFGDRLNFEIDCEPGFLDIPIPQLLIQPLVENAIKHGLSQITENGFIKVSIVQEEQKLGIRIYDNGQAFPEGPLPGFGIRNTQERIALLYGSKASMNWENKPEKFIGLSLPIENHELNQQ